MAICDTCHKEMTDHVGCLGEPLNGAPAIPYSLENIDDCNDCGTPPGDFHHVGCDLERCPCCRGQRLTCGCDETLALTR